MIRPTIIFIGIVINILIPIIIVSITVIRAVKILILMIIVRSTYCAVAVAANITGCAWGNFDKSLLIKYLENFDGAEVFSCLQILARKCWQSVYHLPYKFVKILLSQNVIWV